MSAILLEGVVGSHAYGLATPQSDVDTLAVHAADTQQFFNLTNKPEETIVIHQPDYTSHEAEKFLRLARQCNPTAVEILWLEKYDIINEWGQKLVALRDNFFTRSRVRDAYLGYADQQLRRMDRRQPDDTDPELYRQRCTKHARHCARLLIQAHTLNATGVLLVKLVDPETARLLGDQAANGDLRPLLELFALVKAGFDEGSALPEKQDIQPIEGWLHEVRYAFLTPRRSGWPLTSA